MRKDYQEFVEQIKLSLSNTEPPKEVRFQQTLPTITQHLNTVRQGISQALNELGKKFQQQLQGMNDRLDDIVTPEYRT